MSKIMMEVEWTSRFLAGFRFGRVSAGDWAGCPCVGPVGLTAPIVFLKDNNLVMRNRDGVASLPLPVATIGKLAKMNARGTMSVDGDKIPFEVLVALVQQQT